MNNILTWDENLEENQDIKEDVTKELSEEESNTYAIGIC